jgi:biotin transport system substrate-specific component
MNNVTLHAPRYVLGDLLLTHLHRADVLLVTGGAALIGLSAQVAVPIPGSPVPVTAQTLAVFLCAAALGPWRGPAAVLTYVLAGLAGVPWFAGTPVATFGYLVGMIAAAGVVGSLARHRAPWRVIPVLVLGNAIVYAAGVPWLAVALSVDARAAVAAGLTPFLIGDAAKIAIAAGLLLFGLSIGSGTRGTDVLGHPDLTGHERT